MRIPASAPINQPLPFSHNTTFLSLSLSLSFFFFLFRGAKMAKAMALVLFMLLVSVFAEELQTLHPPSKSPTYPPAHSPHHHNHHHHPPTPAPAPAPTHHHYPLTPTPTPAPAPAPHHHHHHPPAPPPVHPPLNPPVPVHPPLHPPLHTFPRSFIAVQGVVYVKSCKYAGVDTLLGATPQLGAVVKLQCNNTKYKLVLTSKTDKNGYFYIEAPKSITTYGAHKCNVVLVSAPNGLKASNLHGGITGANLRPEKPFLSKKLPFVLYTVGPLAFEPHCY
ncbi:hypothetical protein VNO78_11799 [Psophocarpus tetragonolobus]|uniref:Uncharacterized protein n=1 Tax=Psophocarpus tetragonolobus TaxID=3891 RepID=A0AAN9SM35_PSOTE